MITPSFGLTATERVLPNLALDFTTASLDSRITFTRTTGASNPATYVNSSGIIVAATNNEPRFDYDPTTLQCKGLLIEESRTNQITYSSDYSQAAWTKTEMNLGDSIASPVQSINATKIIPSTTNAAHWMRNLSSVTAGTTYAKSVIAKAAENTVLQLAFSSGFTSTYYQNFDLSDGTLGSASGVTGKIQPLGDGWYLCSVASNAATTTTGAVAIAVVPTKTSARFAAFAGDGTSGLYIVEAQLEAGAFATSRIPTTSAALTRNADVATMTGTNFSDWFNASEGTFTAKANSFGTSAVRYTHYASDGTASNRIASYFTTGNSVNSLVTVLGSAQASLLNTGAAQSTVSAGYKLNSFAAATNAGSIATDASGTIPVVDQLTLGSSLGTSGFLNGHLALMQYYSQRLTNNEVQATSKR